VRGRRIISGARVPRYTPSRTIPPSARGPDATEGHFRIHLVDYICTLLTPPLLAHGGGALECIGVQCAHEGPELDANVIESGVGGPIYGTYTMIRDEELFFPTHEEDSAVIGVRRVFKGQTRFDKFGRGDLMKRRKFLPVVVPMIQISLCGRSYFAYLPMFQVDVFRGSPVVSYKAVGISDDLTIEKGSYFWVLLGQVVDGEKARERRLWEVEVHNSNGDTVFFRFVPLDPFKECARVERVVCRRRHTVG